MNPVVWQILFRGLVLLLLLHLQRDFQIYDEDTLQQDKKMGVAKLAVNSLEPESPTEITLNVLQSLDSVKVKDKKGRGKLHLKVRCLRWWLQTTLSLQ